MKTKTKVAIIGSGNIGTDLMIKVMRLSDVLEMGALVGIDRESDGLRRAERMGVPITAGGIDGLLAMPGFRDIEIVFDATMPTRSSLGRLRFSEAFSCRRRVQIGDLAVSEVWPGKVARSQALRHQPGFRHSLSCS
jgi:acetaldehyde dehydrogenase (acetylating)